MADVGVVALKAWRNSGRRTGWFSGSSVSPSMADPARRVLGECGDGCNELPVRERIAVRDGGHAGGTAPESGVLSTMLTLAYLANQFPAAVEPYVGEEIA